MMKEFRVQSSLADTSRRLGQAEFRAVHTPGHRMRDLGCWALDVGRWTFSRKVQAYVVIPLWLVAFFVFSAAPALAKGKGELALRDGKTRIQMPPLAHIRYSDRSGKSWGVMGEISGSLEVARGDFGICLSRQGWRWHTVSSSAGQNLRMTLVLLKKGSKRLMLILWESGPGQCAFSLGEDYETKTKQ